MRIQRLSSHLVNQIAAGEVVERPASVVKELIENSIDAGATLIETHVLDGGLKEILVIDNGSGIEAEDLPLAVERHATSKIYETSDLEAIETMGFRGEALASIASVATVELISRVANSASGQKILIREGKTIEGPMPVGSPVGTQIRVRNLFADVPARLKFMRSPATEFSHVQRMVREIALGHPNLSFCLYHQGRKGIEFLSSNRERRSLEFFRSEKGLVRFAESSDGLSLEAYLSHPDECLDRGDILLYINRRNVRNRSLTAAVRNAFTQALGPGREPFGVVYLDIRADWVDVNVHPQKSEVRCLNQEGLYGWISALLRKQLAAFVTEAPKPSLHPSIDGQHSSAARGDLGVVFSNYQLWKAEDALWIIDLSGLERSNLVELWRHSQSGQPNLTHATAPVLLHGVVSDEFRDALFTVFSEFGFQLEDFGDHTYLLKAWPSMLSETAAVLILDEFLKRHPEISRDLWRETLLERAIDSGISHPTPLTELPKNPESLPFCYRIEPSKLFGSAARKED